MKFSHGSKFDSRKPAAARFVAIASSCTDLRSIHSLSLSLHAFSFVFAMLDEVVSIRRKLWFLTEYSREGLGDSSKLKCVDHRLSYDLGWSIDVQFQKRKKKGIFFLEFPIYVAVYEKFEQRDSNCGHCCPLGARWKWRMEKRHSEVKV